MTALLFLRVAIVVVFQLIFALFLSWEKAIPWWPFSAIATEAVCCFLLVILLKKEKKPFRSILCMPFETFLPLGKVSDFLNRDSQKNRFIAFLKDAAIFFVLILILGIPAILFNGFISQNIPVLRDTKIMGMLPVWALYLMMALLPPAQALIEFPWYYGYIYPRLETYFEKQRDNRRMVASMKALSISLAFFTLQLTLLPLILNPEYILWRALSFVPLLLVIGIVVRLNPRYMVGVNILHAVMAFNVVLQFWNYM